MQVTVRGLDFDVDAIYYAGCPATMIDPPESEELEFRSIHLCGKDVTEILNEDWYQQVYDAALEHYSSDDGAEDVMDILKDRMLDY